MAKTKSRTLTPPPGQPLPELLRVAGRSRPLAEVIRQPEAAQLPLQFLYPADMAAVEDGAEIDPTLGTAEARVAPVPTPGTSYAGLSPVQRAAFLAWVRTPSNPAFPAFQQLYIANLEPRLLENASWRKMTLVHLSALTASPPWVGNPWLTRAIFLGAWLEKNGDLLAALLANPALPADLLSIGLGLQALCETPLTAEELGAALRTWKLGSPAPPELLKLRLDSLTSALGQPPLAYVRAALDERAAAPRPWRTAHRGLRLAIPAPEARPLLEPALRDLTQVADVAPERVPVQGTDLLMEEEEDTDDGVPEVDSQGWRLILEFGSNRSEYFDYTLVQCQKLPGYTQIMDENRRMVYRVTFRKSEMRRFWRIWEYVQGWTSTQVYLNGTPVEKWKVWPYSQYLK